MAVVDSYSLTVEENADFPTLTFAYYTDYPTTLFNFTGYSAQMMVRVNASDAASVLTLTPTLGGSAGTLAFSMTAVQTSGLVTSLPNLTGYYDILITSSGGVKTHFIKASPINVIRSITR